MPGWTSFYYAQDIQFETGESGWLVSYVSRNKTVAEAKLTLHPKNSDWLELCSLETFPQYQNLGYASELLKCVEQEFGDRYSHMVLIAQPFKSGLSREQLESFYLKRGFTKQTTIGEEAFLVLSKPI